MTNDHDIDALMNKAVDAIESHEFEAAFLMLDRVIALDSQFVPALGVKGSILGQLDRHEEALHCFQHIVTIDPTRCDAYYSCGIHLTALNQTEEAIEAYTQAIAADATFVDAMVNRGRLLDDNGAPKAAVEDYDRAIALGDNDALVWTNRANSLVGLEQFSQALESAQRALALEPGYQDAQLIRARALMSLGQIAEANDCRLKAHRLDPGEACEVSRSLDKGLLIIRYYVKTDANSDFMAQTANSIFDVCMDFKHSGRGLADGVTIKFGWTLLTLKQQGNNLVICEPGFSRTPEKELQFHMTNTIMRCILTSGLVGTLKLGYEECFLYDEVVLHSTGVYEEKVLLYRISKTEDGFSGWVIGASSEADALEMVHSGENRLPSIMLSKIAPYLIYVLTLPVGYQVEYINKILSSITNDKGQCIFTLSK